MKIAARNERCLASYSTEQIDREIDRIVETLQDTNSQIQGWCLTYLNVRSALRKALDPIKTLGQLDIAVSASVDDGEDAFCIGCVVS